MLNRIVRFIIIDKKEYFLNFKLEYINIKLFFICIVNNIEILLFKKNSISKGWFGGFIWDEFI